MSSQKPWMVSPHCSNKENALALPISLAVMALDINISDWELTRVRLQRIAEVQLQCGVFRAQVDRAAHEHRRFGVLALLVAQHAEQMQRVDMAGVMVERGAVIAFGVIEAAVTMRRERAVKYRLHDGEGIRINQTEAAFSHTCASGPDLRGSWACGEQRRQHPRDPPAARLMQRTGVSMSGGVH